MRGHILTLSGFTGDRMPVADQLKLDDERYSHWVPDRKPLPDEMLTGWHRTMRKCLMNQSTAVPAGAYSTVVCCVAGALW